MLATVQVDWCKCMLFFLGKVQIDKRAEMGRVESAPSGQQLSILLVGLACIATLALFRMALSYNGIPDYVATWLQEKS